MVDFKRIVSVLRQNWMDLLGVLSIVVALAFTSMAFSTQSAIYIALAALFAAIGIVLILMPIVRSKGIDIFQSGSISRLVISVSLIVVLVGVSVTSVDVASVGFGTFLIGFILMAVSG